ncbi:MAG: sigma-70 family RNA polymerase sigma factor [Candidatus Euphemobacter frigidus]|nr:sigma-70 family RNA polymerase sigma factor [Candidatus Euphemobacter frigidus]MDP8276444.1 sigma-70 family RNA polymerase sigma factor [Candidatus Euphemobacter frigidus]
MNEEVIEGAERARKDTDLVRAFLAGDKVAFDRLVLKYQNRVFNTCYRLLGNYEEANDSAQDIFVKVFRSLKRFRFESSFSTWIYRIAVNTCRNKLRSLQYRYRRKMIRIDEQKDPEEESYAIEIGDESQSPVKELERKEKGILIQKAIDSLPEGQKTMIVLRDIEGLTYDEIATVTGLNPGTVRSKLARGRQKLRKYLRGIN